MVNPKPLNRPPIPSVLAMVPNADIIPCIPNLHHKSISAILCRTAKFDGKHVSSEIIWEHCSADTVAKTRSYRVLDTAACVFHACLHHSEWAGCCCCNSPRHATGEECFRPSELVAALLVCTAFLNLLKTQGQISGRQNDCQHATS